MLQILNLIIFLRDLRSKFDNFLDFVHRDAFQLVTRLHLSHTLGKGLSILRSSLRLPLCAVECVLCNQSLIAKTFEQSLALLFNVFRMLQPFGIRSNFHLKKPIAIIELFHFRLTRSKLLLQGSYVVRVFGFADESFVLVREQLCVFLQLPHALIIGRLFDL